jgi:LPS sulfotransferase NodH
LLVESLRATGCAGEPQEFFQYLPDTGMAPQPREWFAGVEDESILGLLEPLTDRGTPDTATPVAWREHIRSSGRTPNGVWGGKLMWNQTALLQERASQLPDCSGDGLRAAIRDVIGSEPVYVQVYRPDVVSPAVSFWRAVQTQVWRAHSATRLPPAPSHTSSEPARSGKRLARGSPQSPSPIDIPYRCWRNLTAIIGHILEGLGQIRSWRPHRC